MHRLWLLLFLALSATSTQGRLPMDITSPDGKITVSFRLEGAGIPAWQVARAGSLILSWSRLGLELEGAPPLGSGFIVAGTATAEGDQTYELVAAKTKLARDHFRELRIHLKESAPPHRRLDLFFRAYDDGAAFKYELPMDGPAREFAIVRELTEFRFPSDMKAWAFQINTFRSSFEGLYNPTTVDGIPDTALVHPPLTMQRLDGVTLSITEAFLSDYAGMYLRGLPGAGLQVVLAPLPGGVCVRGKTPFSSPWRVLMIGAKPGDLIESTLIENLNPPCALKDVSWIKPGKAIFPWWPDFYCDRPGVPSRMGFENQKYYVDFAAECSFEYLELEPPWYGPEGDCIINPGKYDITRPIPELRLPELFAHARSKNVGIFLWAHWQNVDRQADSAFALYRKWGAVGVKIDFMDRDDQEMVRWYHTTLKKAAEHHLMVYFHGAYKPTGTRRTYPNLVTLEGVLGNEQNKVSMLATPEHTVTLPYARMLAGPMDFTPGGFRNATAAQFKPVYSRPMVMGTRCHQLAMFVVYESPLMMVCDDPAAYRGQPGLDFLRVVPTAWDETRVIDGQIAEYIVIARRRGAEWFLGAMTDWNPRELSIPLSFLGPGKFRADVYADGNEADVQPTSVSVGQKSVTAGSVLPVRLARGGGLAIRFHPE